MKITIEEIGEFLKENEIEYRYTGNIDFTCNGFCPLSNLKENSLTWARKVENINFDSLNMMENILIFISTDTEIQSKVNVIFVDNPHRTFFKVLQHFFVDVLGKGNQTLISSTAVVETKKLGLNIKIGNHTYIGPDVTIGNDVIIHNNVSIEGHVEIGDHTVIESGVVIGVCGFGHYQEDNGVSVRVPHLGGVKIGRYVNIGANSTVSRGCLDDTVICDYVKIDNLCHIAHNDLIKSRTMITACVEISGSTTVEEDVWIGPGCSLNNLITVGKGSFLGIGTVVTKDVPAGKVVAGVPARVLRDNK
jgi:UDP-3-O-[3-hydroxymyristoyl] glucosamine N-acyltransferase LpxD